MKKLEKWRQRIKNLHVSSYEYDGVGSYLLSKGFKRILSRYDVYINKQDKVVCKIPYIIGRKPTKVAVPTLTVRKHGELWYIQPLCKNFNIRDKRTQIELLKYAYPNNDMHKGNLGLYRNKVVAFDW